MNNSYKTAITRKKPSAPMRWLAESIEGYLFSSKKFLDYGCGKGYDADYYCMGKYDPHFFPEKPNKKYDIITCNYVLNVLPKDKEQEVLNDIKSLLKRNGKAYISVRRDKFKEGLNSKGTYQRYVELDAKLLVENSNFAIYEIKK